MRLKFKIFPDKQYKEIIKEVGKYRYSIYEDDEILPGKIFKKTLDFQNYNCIVAGTGSTLSLCSLKLDYYNEAVIPKGEEVVVIRLLRFDDNHGKPHYNADDQIIFPTLKGDVIKLARKDAPDHYLEIAQIADMLPIADAYKLPIAKTGPIEKYSERGAKLHIELLPHE